MNKLFLFESGSTKTNVLVQNTIESNENGNGGEIQELTLSGYNPNRASSYFLEELKTIEIGENDHVFFYGSGLAAESNRNELKSIFKKQFNVEMEVYDDMLGAARALYHNESGVFAILGTGGVAGYYNGTQVTDRKGGYGYLIDDLGGGYELGKRIVSAWLNGQLSASLENAIADLFEVNQNDFVRTYYRNPEFGYTANGLKKMADTVRLIATRQDDPIIKDLTFNYFSEFFRRHVSPLYNEHVKREIKLSGSLAEIFYESLQKVATKFGLVITGTLQFPAHKLLTYHQQAKCLNKE